MNEVAKTAGVLVTISAASVVNLALGAIAVIVFLFIFRTIYNKGIEPAVINFGKEVKEEAEKESAKKSLSLRSTEQ